jgi:hypothetical protein
MIKGRVEEFGLAGIQKEFAPGRIPMVQVHEILPALIDK